MIAAGHEDELRGFFNLIAARSAANRQLAWALARFEMGAERSEPFEAVTDYLLAARSLLEPEGTGAGRLAERLAAICARPADRDEVSARIARVQELDRVLATGGLPRERDSEALVAELRESLRALLRDMLCGHLDGDVCALADKLLAQTGSAGPLEPAPEQLRSAPTDEPTEEVRVTPAASRRVSA